MRKTLVAVLFIWLAMDSCIAIPRDAIVFGRGTPANVIENFKATQMTNEERNRLIQVLNQVYSKSQSLTKNRNRNTAAVLASILQKLPVLESLTDLTHYEFWSDFRNTVFGSSGSSESSGSSGSSGSSESSGSSGSSGTVAVSPISWPSIPGINFPSSSPSPSTAASPDTSSCQDGSVSVVGSLSVCTCNRGYTGGGFADANGAFPSCEQICMPGKYEKDGTCLDCRPSCGAGENEVQACTSGTDRVCSGCTASQYAEDSSTCGICTSCPAGKKESQSCSATTSTSCEDCPEGTYRTTLMSASTCETCSSCPATRSTKTMCTATSDTVCHDCAPGMYEKSDGNCEACTTCLSGTYITKRCTATEDATCSTCPAGKYSQAGADSCTLCESGKYSSAAGSAICTNCDTCVDGYYTTTTCDYTRNSVCAKCPAGKFSERDNEPLCHTCPAGFYADADSTKCERCKKCNPGEYVKKTCSVIEDAECDFCDLGTYSTHENSASCLSCPSGKYASYKAQDACAECTSCPAGKYAATSCTANTDRDCVSCPSGYYTDDADQSECKQCSTTCEAGEYEESACTATNDMQCTPCDENTYNSDGDPNTCTPCTDCTAGKYIASECTSSADRVCSTCPSGKFTDKQNQNTCASCTTCPAGKVTNGVTCGDRDSGCEDCAVGKYSITVDATVCQDCDVCTTGEYISTPCSKTTNRVCSSCQSGKYADLQNLSECKDCLPCSAGYVDGACDPISGRECTAVPCGNGDTTNPSLCVCNAGYEGGGAWNSGTASYPSCTACPNGKYSTGSGTSCLDWTSCAASEGLTGESSTQPGVCESCVAGKYRAPSNDCETCSTCSQGKYESAACTAEQDTTCTSCEHNQFYDEPARRCKACLTCEAGKFIKTACDPTNYADTICEACPSGEYSVADASTCGPCSDPCGVGYYESVSCTAATNRECKEASCSHGTISPDRSTCTCEDGSSKNWNPGTSTYPNCPAPKAGPGFICGVSAIVLGTGGLIGAGVVLKRDHDSSKADGSSTDGTRKSRMIKIGVAFIFCIIAIILGAMAMKNTEDKMTAVSSVLIAIVALIIIIMAFSGQNGKTESTGVDASTQALSAVEGGESSSKRSVFGSFGLGSFGLGSFGLGSSRKSKTPKNQRSKEVSQVLHQMGDLMVGSKTPKPTTTGGFLGGVGNLFSGVRRSGARPHSNTDNVDAPVEVAADPVPPVADDSDNAPESTRSDKLKEYLEIWSFSRRNPSKDKIVITNIKKTDETACDTKHFRLTDSDGESKGCQACLDEEQCSAMGGADFNAHAKCGIYRNHDQCICSENTHIFIDETGARTCKACAPITEVCPTTRRGQQIANTKTLCDPFNPDGASCSCIENFYRKPANRQDLTAEERLKDQTRVMKKFRANKMSKGDWESCEGCRTAENLKCDDIGSTFQPCTGLSLFDDSQCTCPAGHYFHLRPSKDASSATKSFCLECSSTCGPSSKGHPDCSGHTSTNKCVCAAGLFYDDASNQCSACTVTDPAKCLIQDAWQGPCDGSKNFDSCGCLKGEWTRGIDSSGILRSLAKKCEACPIEKTQCTEYQKASKHLAKIEHPDGPGASCCKCPNWIQGKNGKDAVMTFLVHHSSAPAASDPARSINIEMFKFESRKWHISGLSGDHTQFQELTQPVDTDSYTQARKDHYLSPKFTRGHGGLTFTTDHASIIPIQPCHRHPVFEDRSYHVVPLFDAGMENTKSTINTPVSDDDEASETMPAGKSASTPTDPLLSSTAPPENFLVNTYVRMLLKFCAGAKFDKTADKSSYNWNQSEIVSRSVLARVGSAVGFSGRDESNDIYGLPYDGNLGTSRETCKHFIKTFPKMYYSETPWEEKVLTTGQEPAPYASIKFYPSWNADDMDNKGDPMNAHVYMYKFDGTKPASVAQDMWEKAITPAA